VFFDRHGKVSLVKDANGGVSRSLEMWAENGCNAIKWYVQNTRKYDASIRPTNLLRPGIDTQRYAISFTSVSDIQNYMLPSSNFTVVVGWTIRSRESWNSIWGCDHWNADTGYVLYMEGHRGIRFVAGGESEGDGPVPWRDTGYTLGELVYYTVSLSSSGHFKLYKNSTKMYDAQSFTIRNVTQNLKINARHRNDGNGTTDFRINDVHNFLVFENVLSENEIGSLVQKLRSE